MSFSVAKQAATTKARLGHLNSHSKENIETPSLLVTTSRGCIPHLTPDTFNRTLTPDAFVALCAHLEWLVEDDLILAKTSPTSLGNLMGYPKVPIWLANRDPDYVQGKYPLRERGQNESLRLTNGPDWVALCTDGGVTPFNLRTAMSIIMRCSEDDPGSTILRPEAVICPLDHYPQARSRLKRIKKSTDTGLGYLKILQENHQPMTTVIPSLHLHLCHGEPSEKEPMVGAEMNRRLQAINWTHSPIVAMLSSDVESLQSVPFQTQTAILLRGSVAPGHYKKYIAAGVDIFESSYATDLATESKALTMTIDSKEIILDMRNARYFDDFAPLSTDCQCIACAGPERTTRSYIHHLVMTQEMLASVFLSSHNLWQCADYLRRLRERLLSDSDL